MMLRKKQESPLAEIIKVELKELREVRNNAAFNALMSKAAGYLGLMGVYGFAAEKMPVLSVTAAVVSVAALATGEFFRGKEASRNDLVRAKKDELKQQRWVDHRAGEQLEAMRASVQWPEPLERTLPEGAAALVTQQPHNSARTPGSCAASHS